MPSANPSAGQDASPASEGCLLNLVAFADRVIAVAKQVHQSGLVVSSDSNGAMTMAIKIVQLYHDCAGVEDDKVRFVAQQIQADTQALPAAASAAQK